MSVYAFPFVVDQGDGSYEQHSGMTLRDYFAAKALQGFCSNPAVFASNHNMGWRLVNFTEQQLSAYCIFLADAMLAERDK